MFQGKKGKGDKTYPYKRYLLPFLYLDVLFVCLEKEMKKMKKMEKVKGRVFWVEKKLHGSGSY